LKPENCPEHVEAFGYAHNLLHATPDTIHIELNYLSGTSLLDLIATEKNLDTVIMEKDLECILHNLWNHTKRFGYQDSRLNLMVQW
jgi:hypothetical protein